METVAPFCENDRLFLHLYAELYYRHLYVIGQHSLRDMIDSWRNWCALFDFLIENRESGQYVLPLEWLYDIVNEYVYQFQSFCQLRNKASTLAADDMEALLQNEATWSPQTVIETLGALTKAARVKESISGQDTGVKSQPLATLGYFAMIGKARVHIVLGDYRMVLSSLMPIQLFEQGLFTRVTACHIMIYYCAGFAYMMLRRYVDASACFRRILIFLSRTKNYQKREIQKKHDQIVALLAIASALCPGVQIEGSVRELLNEQHGDKLPRLQAGQLNVYKDLFNYACPKFISPNTPAVIDAPSAYSQVRGAWSPSAKLNIAGRKACRARVCRTECFHVDATHSLS